MKKINYIALFFIVLFGSACERTLDFKGPDTETDTDMIINAFAIEGTSLIVYLNRAYLIDKVPSIQYYDYQHAIFFKDDFTTDYQTYDYYKRTAILDADIEVNVNGQESYHMSATKDSLGYVSNYVPQAGDHIIVKAKKGESEVFSETIIPSKPNIEIISHEVLAENPYQDINGLVTSSDTIMRLTCRILDTGGQNYYRLRIRSECTAYIWAWKEVYYIMQDVYFSDDDLFMDDRLNESFGGWPAYFSNVFDNSLMKGKEYTFTLDSPKATLNKDFVEVSKSSYEGPEIPPRVMVELQAISPELYRYLKSVQLYRVTASDAYAEPVQIYGNVEGGWGIFGALSYDRHFVEFGE